MFFPITPDSSTTAPLLKYIATTCNRGNTLFKQEVASRAAVIALIATSIFDSIAHTLIAFLNIPVATTKFLIDTLPIRLDWIRDRLSGSMDASGVARHALRAAKYALEFFIIPVSLVLPEKALPLHIHVGLVKPEPIPVIPAPLTSWEKVTQFMQTPMFRTGAAVTVALVAVAIGIWRANGVTAGVDEQNPPLDPPANTDEDKPIPTPSGGLIDELNNCQPPELWRSPLRANICNTELNSTASNVSSCVGDACKTFKSGLPSLSTIGTFNPLKADTCLNSDAELDSLQICSVYGNSSLSTTPANTDPSPAPEWNSTLFRQNGTDSASTNSSMTATPNAGTSTPARTSSWTLPITQSPYVLRPDFMNEESCGLYENSSLPDAPFKYKPPVDNTADANATAENSHTQTEATLTSQPVQAWSLSGLPTWSAIPLLAVTAGAIGCFCILRSSTENDDVVRSELLFKLMEGCKPLAITGTHGKTTTTASTRRRSSTPQRPSPSTAIASSAPKTTSLIPQLPQAAKTPDKKPQSIANSPAQLPRKSSTPVLPPSISNRTVTQLSASMSPGSSTNAPNKNPSAPSSPKIIAPGSASKRNTPAVLPTTKSPGVYSVPPSSLPSKKPGEVAKTLFSSFVGQSPQSSTPVKRGSIKKAAGSTAPAKTPPSNKEEFQTVPLTPQVPPSQPMPTTPAFSLVQTAADFANGVSPHTPLRDSHGNQIGLGSLSVSRKKKLGSKVNFDSTLPGTPQPQVQTPGGPQSLERKLVHSPHPSKAATPLHPSPTAAKQTLFNRQDIPARQLMEGRVVFTPVKNPASSSSERTPPKSVAQNRPRPQTPFHTTEERKTTGVWTSIKDLFTPKPKELKELLHISNSPEVASIDDVKSPVYLSNSPLVAGVDQEFEVVKSPTPQKTKTNGKQAQNKG